MDSIQKPGVVIKPQMNEEVAKDLVYRLYGYQVIAVKEMNSYDDRNYLISVKKEEQLLHFTLKITNSLESNVPGLIEAFNEIGHYISEKGLVVPVSVVNNEGKYSSRIKLHENVEELNAIRLLSFIPGELLRNVEYSEQLLIATGELLAKLTVALQEFDNQVLKERSLIWSLRNVIQIKNFMFAIRNERRKEIVLDVLHEFEKNVVTQIHTFKHAIIHGDFNEQNIIVRKSKDTFEPYGILDFGDCHYAPLVFDLAICCTYVMLDCNTMDPLLAPGYVIQGYAKHRPITEDELKIIPLCIKARLSQSLVMGAYAYYLDPSNEYTLSSSKNGWQIIEKMRACHDSQLLQKWESVRTRN